MHEPNNRLLSRVGAHKRGRTTGMGTVRLEQALSEMMLKQRINDALTAGLQVSTAMPSLV